jgi:hypothetical protein
LVNAGDTVCSVCPSGYYQPGPLTVQADKAGSNVRETGLAQCKLCPDGRVSLPGTKLSDDCGECFQQQLCTYVVRQHKMIPLACASRAAVSQGMLDCRPVYVQTCNVCCGIRPVMSCVLCCHVSAQCALLARTARGALPALPAPGVLEASKQPSMLAGPTGSHSLAPSPPATASAYQVCSALGCTGNKGRLNVRQLVLCACLLVDLRAPSALLHTSMLVAS